MGLFSRAIRPPPEDPNANPPGVAPASVGPPDADPGDPHGLTLDFPPMAGASLPPIIPSAWDGWPAEWGMPWWNGQSGAALTDTAWACLDLNSSVLSTMPPYLVGNEDVDSQWLVNPDADVYTSWEEFSKQLFWDYQLGEDFVLATARYATGYPARFHVVPPWAVEVNMAGGGRAYSIGQVDVTADMLHVRYQGSVDDAHGHGPLEAGSTRLIADQILGRYVSLFAQAGGVPTSVLTHPEELTADQAATLQAQWVQARASTLGEPAVLSVGVTY